MTSDETRPPPTADAPAPPRGVPVHALSYFAHEMGNPLGAILGLAQLMASERADPLTDVQARRLAQLTAAPRQLRALLDDLVDFSVLDSGRLHLALQPLDLGAQLHLAIAQATPQAMLAGVELALEVPMPAPWVKADANRLQQCLGNLLGNAIKYNRAGGNVHVAVEPAAGHVRIAVHDDGFGLDDAQLARLFTPFDRLGRESGNAPGSGLGLLITRELLCAMGGALDVASRAGRGSRFTIVLPVAAAQPLPRAQEQRP